jgi:hypothetical protein
VRSSPPDRSAGPRRNFARTLQSEALRKAADPPPLTTREGTNNHVGITWDVSCGSHGSWLASILECGARIAVSVD